MLDKMQSLIHFNSRWTLQLIHGISNDLQKFLRCFNETIVFAFFTELFVLLTVSAAFPAGAALYLNDLELSILKSALLTGTSSLLNCHKLPDVFQ